MKKYTSNNQLKKEKNILFKVITNTRYLEIKHGNLMTYVKLCIKCY